MLNVERIPREYTKGKVDKISIGDQNEVQYLHLDPFSSILMHDHDGEQWEAWIHLAKNTVYLCMKDEEHELINDSKSEIVFMAIKGRSDYTYDDLSQFFFMLGYSVYIGSAHITD